MDEERWPPETMGAVRDPELERSLEILGVAEHFWLDLPDIDMETGLPEEGYGRVRDLVEDVRPDTILTFGPDGMTGHEAHKSVSLWATEALQEVGRPGARVLYACVTPEWAPSSSRSGSRSTSSCPARRPRSPATAGGRPPLPTTAGAEGARDQGAREPGRGDRRGRR